VKRFAAGLVVGKFSPLHRGHEYLLRTALARCDQVFCISYSRPELPGCGAAVRRRWLSELFPDLNLLVLGDAELRLLAQEHPELPALPNNDASELSHRVFCAELCWRVFGVPVDAVFTSEHYGDGFAAELQTQFRSAGHRDARVEHVLVDLERRAVPTSATAIRADRALHEPFLSPVVLGGESSGKTTLTRLLARAFDTAHCEEYGRELWLERKGALGYDDFLTIALKQLELEEAAARVARRILLCDTSPLTTLFYCLDQFGRAEPELSALARRAYDLTLIAAPDFPFVQDGTRRDAAFRLRQHEFYLAELERLSLPWVLIEGLLDDRLARARAAIASQL
jgi:HTH-type transcriptional regulator, transcriptional repressor of NAD biosynthesis genes